jgi:hypothetical protein
MDNRALAAGRQSQNISSIQNLFFKRLYFRDSNPDDRKRWKATIYGRCAKLAKSHYEL